jgi:hypothetical protein
VIGVQERIWTTTNKRPKGFVQKAEQFKTVQFLNENARERERERERERRGARAEVGVKAVESLLIAIDF